MDFHQLLTECVKRSASDLHLKSGSRPIVRVHGHLEVQDDLASVSRDFMRKTAMTLLGEIRYNALMEGEEMDLAHTVPGIGRFRINALDQCHAAGTCNPGTGLWTPDNTNNICCEWNRDPPNQSPSMRVGTYFGGGHPGSMNACASSPRCWSASARSGEASSSSRASPAPASPPRSPPCSTS